MSQTGENEQGLRKKVDLARTASFVILLLHFCVTVTPCLQHGKFMNVLVSFVGKKSVLLLAFFCTG
jgi:hypothetical protein